MIKTSAFEYKSIKASLNLCNQVITVLMHCVSPINTQIYFCYIGKLVCGASWCMAKFGTDIFGQLICTWQNGLWLTWMKQKLGILKGYHL
jgi:hypothetical protein